MQMRSLTSLKTWRVSGLRLRKVGSLTPMAASGLLPPPGGAAATQHRLGGWPRPCKHCRISFSVIILQGRPYNPELALSTGAPYARIG